MDEVERRIDRLRPLHEEDQADFDEINALIVSLTFEVAIFEKQVCLDGPRSQENITAEARLARVKLLRLAQENRKLRFVEELEEEREKERDDLRTKIGTASTWIGEDVNCVGSANYELVTSNSHARLGRPLQEVACFSHTEGPLVRHGT